MRFSLSRLSVSTIEFELASEITFVPEMKRIEVMSLDGETCTFKGALIEDILDGSEIEYVHFPKNNCVLMLSTSGYTLYRINLGKVSMNVVCKLRRTDLINEGFDYCYFHSDPGTDGLVFLCYEHGLAAFDTCGEELWHKNIRALRVPPEFEGDCVCYHEISHSYKYRKIDGAEIG